MTAKQFVAKFPLRTEIMENSCEDLACPECGAREFFNIAFEGRCVVSDEGSKDVGDHGWDSTKHCMCDCGYEGTVADFTVRGLDRLLRELKQKENKP